MRDLEQRVQAECLGKIGAQASEHVIVEEHIALDLLGQTLNGAGVRQAQLCAALLEGADGICEGFCDGVVEQDAEWRTRD